MTVRTVTRRGKRRLVIDIHYTRPDGSSGRYRRDAEIQTMAAARTEERRLTIELSTGQLTATPAARPDPTPAKAIGTGPTFQQLAEAYREEFAPSHLKPSAQRGYEAVLDAILLPELGGLPITSIGARESRRIDAMLAGRGARPSTRRNAQVVLRSVLRRYAVEAGHLPAPPPLPPLPRVGRTALRLLTEEEFRTALAIASPSHRRAYLLAARAGLRTGEVRGLRWRDVDLAAGELVVRQAICHGATAPPKSGHERRIPLATDLQRELETTPAPKRLRDALVAVTEAGGRWSESGLRQAFRRDCVRAGVDATRFHDLRHLFVTSLFRAGTPAPTVQALAGHADLATTQRYAHVAQLDLADGIRRLDKGTKET